MKISLDYIDSTFNFEGEWGVESKCGLKIIKGLTQNIIVAAELPDNPGTQITSFSAELAEQICKANNIPVESIIYLEHTPNMNSKLSLSDESFYRVRLEQKDGKLTSLKWEKLTRAKVDEILSSIK